VVEHDLAKVGVEGSNPFARSNKSSMAELNESPRWSRAFVFASDLCSAIRAADGRRSDLIGCRATNLKISSAARAKKRLLKLMPPD
jgi:hypothetical protein